MTDDDALSRLEDVVDQIVQMHDARLESHVLDNGKILLSIETDDWNLTGEGRTEAQALSDLIKRAKEAGRAE